MTHKSGQDIETRLEALEHQSERQFSIPALNVGYLEQPKITESHVGIRRRGGDRLYVPGAPSGIRDTSGTFSPTINLLLALPIYNSQPLTIDMIRVRVTTSVASGKCRIGIYDVADRDLLTVGRRLVDFGEIDVSSLGDKDLTISRYTMSRGLSWIAAVVNVSGLAFLSIVSTDRWMIMGHGGAFAGATGWTATFTYAALPESFPSGQALGSPAIAIGLRTVAS